MRAPHVVLGIPAGSPERDIRRAYRRLAKQLHPDRAAPADRAAAHARFIELRAAYEAMLAQAAVVEVGAEEGAGPPKGEVTFRPAGRQRGDPATGTGVVETGGRQSRPWMYWAVGLVAVAALVVGPCMELGWDGTQRMADASPKVPATAATHPSPQDHTDGNGESEDSNAPESTESAASRPDIDDAGRDPGEDGAKSEGGGTWGEWVVGNVVEFCLGLGRDATGEALPCSRPGEEGHFGDRDTGSESQSPAEPPAPPDSDRRPFGRPSRAERHVERGE